MKLYLLKPVDNLPFEGHPWSRHYDTAKSFVIRASDEAHARHIASAYSGDEKKNAWLESKYSTCEALSSRGLPGLIIRDFNAG